MEYFHDQLEAPVTHIFDIKDVCILKYSIKSELSKWEILPSIFFVLLSTVLFMTWLSAGLTSLVEYMASPSTKMLYSLSAYSVITKIIYSVYV